MPSSGLGWQPSRFLTDRAEAERAFALAEQLGSVNAAAQELGTTWPSLRKAFTRHGLRMPGRDPEAVYHWSPARPPAQRSAVHPRPGSGICGEAAVRHPAGLQDMVGVRDELRHCFRSSCSWMLEDQATGRTRATDAPTGPATVDRIGGALIPRLQKQLSRKPMSSPL
jgi:hypothetical protein